MNSNHRNGRMTGIPLSDVDRNINLDFEDLSSIIKIAVSLWVFGIECTDWTQTLFGCPPSTMSVRMWSPNATLLFIVHNYVVNCSSNKYLISSSVQWETVPVVRQKVWHTPTRPKQVGTFHNPYTPCQKTFHNHYIFVEHEPDECPRQTPSLRPSITNAQPGRRTRPLPALTFCPPSHQKRL